MASDKKFVRIFAKVDKFYVEFSNVLSCISALCLVAAMVIAFVDVLLAKLVNSGIPGQYELIQMLSVPMLYLTMSYTQLTRDQIKLTLLMDRLPKAVGEAIIYLGYVLGVFISFFMAWQSFRNVLKLFRLNSRTTGVLNLPQWPFCMMLVVGCVCVGIAYIFSILRRALKFNRYVGMEDLGKPEGAATPDINLERSSQQKRGKFEMKEDDEK